jgi:alpha-D-ribose 1-methylphosphonate 5-triphosphate synthase subunit PhnL
VLQRRVRDAIVIGLVGVAEHALDHRAQVVKEVLREHKGRGETVQLVAHDHAVRRVHAECCSAVYATQESLLLVSSVLPSMHMIIVPRW